MPPILTAKNLQFSRNDTPLFSGVHFSLNPGEIIHIKGPNGVGKSTLLRILGGLLHPEKGSIESLISSKDLIYIGHKLAIKDLLTPEENLFHFMLNQDSDSFHLDDHSLVNIDSSLTRQVYWENKLMVDDWKTVNDGFDVKLPSETIQENSKLKLKIKKILFYFNLHILNNTKILARDLSAGQRQRLALSRLMIKPVKLWLLDEPLTALDQHAIEQFSEMLRSHCKQGGAAIIASHQPLVIAEVPITTLELEHQVVS